MNHQPTETGTKHVQHRVRIRRRQLFLGLGALALMLAMAVAVLYVANLRTPAMAWPVTASFTEFQKAIELAPEEIDGYRYLSQAYQMAGQTAGAETVWRRAAQANPAQAWPLVELGRFYEGQGWLRKARDAYFRAATLDPQDKAANQNLARTSAAVAALQSIQAFLVDQSPELAGSTTAQGIQMVGEQLPNGWTFLGYQTDMPTLAQGQPANIWTFWQAPSVEIEPTLQVDSWVPVAPGIWGRMTETATIFPGGDFEAGPAGDGLAVFPSDLYRAPAETRQLQQITRGAQMTTVGALINRAQNRFTSFVSRRKSLSPNTAYLVSADVLNNDGNPAVGWHWSGNIDDTYLPLDRYAQPTSGLASWQTYVGLASPLPGANSVQAWLLNTATEGAAYFDNVVFAPVPLPAPVWPGAQGQAAARAMRFADLIDKYAAYPPVAHDKQWQDQMARLGPAIKIGQQLATGWTLQGYTTDEALLAAGKPALLALFWQAPAGVAPNAASGDWIDLRNDQWLQIIPAATNLMPQGAFEQGLNLWAADIFSSPAQARQTMVTDRLGLTTTVGLLGNTSAYSNTSFVSPSFVVNPDTLFLQTGWLKGGSSRAYIGRLWKGEIAPDLAPYDTYIAAAQAPSTWRHFAGVAEPPPGAAEVDVWVLNYLSEHPAYFDNITFVPIPAPWSAMTASMTTTAQPTATGELTAAGAISQTAAVTVTVAKSTTPVSALELLSQYVSDPAVASHEPWLAQIAAAGPARALGQPMDGAWTFVGYTADETALAAGASTGAFYFWRGPQDAVPGDAVHGWYNLDAGYWLQAVAQTSSLLPNGARQYAAYTPASIGLPSEVTCEKPALTWLQTMPPAGLTATAAVLTATEISGTASLTSSILPINAQMFYLEAALIRTVDESHGYLGAVWMGDNLSPDLDTNAVVSTSLTAPDWAVVAGLLEPLPTAAGMQITVHNDSSSGRVKVDWIIVLPVLPPLPIAPALGIHRSGTRLAF